MRIKLHVTMKKVEVKNDKLDVLLIDLDKANTEIKNRVINAEHAQRIIFDLKKD